MRRECCAENREAHLAQEQALLIQLGKQGWRPYQREFVQWALQGHSSLAVLPTGYGKSLCFQMAALLLGGTSIVVSPLIALMQDQVQSLQNVGIAAARYDSSLSEAERELVLQRLRSGDLCLLYVAPESLENAALLDILPQIELSLFVVDEAHCVSAWGHSFRPDYLKLPDYYRAFRFRSLMALTATATPQVQQDLQQAFAIQPQHSLVLSPYRNNITRHVRVTHDKLAELCSFLGDGGHRPAIIYARSRKNVEELAEQLKNAAYPQTQAYHAGLPAELRLSIQQDFLRGTSDVLVASIAFGMGVDKSDVRSVIHYHAPSSPEAYVQESGRAGRDGQSAQSLVLIDAQDDIEISNRIWAEEPDAEGILRATRWLIPPHRRVVSLWELETECDIPSELPMRILAKIDPAVKQIARGYKYYKVKPLFPLASIVDGRDERETAQLRWLDEHREGEVEHAAEAWDCSYSEAMEQLRECEAAQEWQLTFRQQALQLQRDEELDTRRIADELILYYQQRRQSSFHRWAQLRHMLTGTACINRALNHYFMGEDSFSECQHCSPCAGRVVELPQQPAPQPEIPRNEELPEFAREGQRKRFLLGIISPALMRRRLWGHCHYGCARDARWEDL